MPTATCRRSKAPSAALLALALIGLAACGRGGRAADPCTRARQADAICACRDMRCFEGVLKQMAACPPRASPPTKAWVERDRDLAVRMHDCQRKLMTADPAPPAPAPQEP